MWGIISPPGYAKLAPRAKRQMRRFVCVALRLRRSKRAAGWLGHHGLLGLLLLLSLKRTARRDASLNSRAIDLSMHVNCLAARNPMPRRRLLLHVVT